MPSTPHVPPEVFFAEIFGSQAARDGAVVRRKVRDVERFIGREVFLAEVRRRGFRLLENAGQFLVICNHEPVRRIL